MAKIEIFPLATGHSCTILRVKNLLEIALSLTVSEIFSIFYFPLKTKMAAKSGENWHFSPLYKILLYYPVGQKFTRNRSISYRSRDIFNVLFSAKIQDGRQKWQKIETFPLCIGYSCTTGFRDTHTFSFSAKIQDGRPKWWKLKFFPYSQDTPVLPCGSKIRSKSLYLLWISWYSHIFIFR